MEKTINTVKNLREILCARSAELEEIIMELEERTCSMMDDTEEAQELIHQTSRAYQELRANDKLMHSLNLCEYCKLSDHNLCDLCG